MKRLAGFFSPLAVLLLMAAPALGQTKYRFEVFGAAMIPRDKSFEIAYPQSTMPLHGTQQFSLGSRGGVRFGAEGKGHWGQDFIYSYGTNSTKIVNQTNSSQFAFTSRTHQFSYNALWYPGGCGLEKKSGVFPFVTAGVGGAFHTLSQATINEALDPNRGGLGRLRGENVFAVNAGGGIRFRINSVYGIRIDVRDYMSRAVRYGLPKTSSDPKVTVFPIGGVFHQIEVSIAFVYFF